MNFCREFVLRGLLLGAITLIAGCCCGDMSALRGRGGAGATNSPVDPDETEELATGTDYAQKALNAKGYGGIASAKLRKDGMYWYVEGTAGGKDGGTVNYIVMFEVTRFEKSQRWNVNTVSVDGQTVYP